MADTEALADSHRTRRAVVLATVGIVVLLSLALFLGLVVLPLWQTDRIVRGIFIGEMGGKEAIRRLGGPERAVERLKAYLYLPRWIKADREKATIVLGFCGAPASPVLEKALADADATVRATAAAALGDIGTEATVAVPALMERLSDADAEVRWSAAIALVRIGPGTEEVVPALVKMLGDADPEVRRRVAGALGYIGPKAKEAVPVLEKLLVDHYPDVRDSAAYAIEKICGEAPARPPTPSPPWRRRRKPRRRPKPAQPEAE